ncbi:polysaccharide pyruvyl transferase family protein [Halomonas sp. LC1]|uniref:polysaccharide pyruvyl transferase family protein n=1 Tax=Halomonas sp. LC1 TaxID=3043733 RepID=UPI002557053F|nr:polysaccharide pyruvyl transferase family protein [Halomonas sp. LC1]MDK9688100.1 polysaccharide pyruvyl transferase family protein [Halomonas sp. LC1]
MRKLGILNFQYSNHNYGAVLQAAALEYLLIAKGYDVRHIDYQPLKKKGVKKLLINLIKRYVPINKNKNEEVFEHFRKKFLHRTEVVTSPSKFSKIATAFDIVIVGSDQVWRPSFSGDPVGFFLGHVPQGIRRVSYAASFGLDSWEQISDKSLTEYIKGELIKFDKISCREDSGVSICSDVFQIDSVHVLDPLLLVDQSFFDNILNESKLKNSAQKNPKVVFYKLDSSDEFEKDLSIIGDKLKCVPVNLYSTDKVAREFRPVDDWVSMICDSEVIVTDSYHCVCIGLRFNKKILFCPNDKRGKARLDSLFRQLDVKVIPFEGGTKLDFYFLEKSESFMNSFEKARINSIDFLDQSLR